MIWRNIALGYFCQHEIDGPCDCGSCEEVRAQEPKKTDKEITGLWVNHIHHYYASGRSNVPCDDVKCPDGQGKPGYEGYYGLRAAIEAIEHPCHDLCGPWGEDGSMLHADCQCAAWVRQEAINLALLATPAPLCQHCGQPLDANGFLHLTREQIAATHAPLDEEAES
jgi:hypothetical protein